MLGFVVQKVIIRGALYRMEERYKGYFTAKQKWLDSPVRQFEKIIHLIDPSLCVTTIKLSTVYLKSMGYKIIMWVGLDF